MIKTFVINGADFVLSSDESVIKHGANTELLDVEQVKEKLLTLQYIRDELAEWENR